jgi:hypothetical protein
MEKRAGVSPALFATLFRNLICKTYFGIASRININVLNTDSTATLTNNIVLIFGYHFPSQCGSPVSPSVGAIILVFGLLDSIEVSIQCAIIGGVLLVPSLGIVQNTWLLSHPWRENRLQSEDRLYAGERGKDR